MPDASPVRPSARLGAVASSRCLNEELSIPVRRPICPLDVVDPGSGRPSSGPDGYIRAFTIGLSLCSRTEVYSFDRIEMLRYDENAAYEPPGI